SALAARATSPEYAAFQSEMNLSAEIVSSVMWRSLGLSGGNREVLDSPMAARTFTFIQVDDPVAYADAWQEWVEAENSKDIHSAMFAIPADGTGGATHAVIHTARSPGALFAPLNNPAAFAEYREKVSGIRERTERVRMVKVKSW
ncbi:MAG: hypothetical protein O3A23_10700, partial [Proteobacteria bacterium]|nr:hypothetical protein [Pseudomonadota bacterium]